MEDDDSSKKWTSSQGIHIFKEISTQLKALKAVIETEIENLEESSVEDDNKGTTE